MHLLSRVRHHQMSLFPRLFIGPLLLSFAILLPGAASGQDPAEWIDWSDQIPAHVAVVDGTGTLERDGTIEPIALNTILVAGDRLRTDQGRIEILFGDGSVLDVDAFSSVDLLSETLVRLLEGRVRLTVARTAGTPYRVDSAGGSAVMRMAGEYRVATGDGRQANPQFELVVYRGSAELGNRQGTTLVRAGTYALASATTVPSLPYSLNSAAWDDFDVWANDQRDTRLGYASTQYLPADLRHYGGDLDRAGSWDYVAGYGDVWYPYVGASWYPYSQGSWSVVASFGWTWVGVERWSWPTHHYGRWGHHGGRWFWVPGRQWSPAWVSWGSAPGYIAWSPLGFDNRPIVSITTVSIRGPRLGWSVVPATYWRPRVHVAGVIVPHNRVRPEAWTQFAEHRGGPAYGGGRGQRGVSPVPGAPAAAGRAVPRNASRGAVTPAPPRSAGPTARVAPAGSARPAARAAAVPAARSASRDVRPTVPAVAPSAQSRSAAARQARPAASTAAAGAPRNARPPVVYYRGRDTAASTPPPSSRAAGRPSPGNSSTAPARVMRSTPPPSPGASTARPRLSTPAPSSGPSRSASPGARRAGPAPRSATPPPSAQPNRGGASRSAPPGSSGRGLARPRGGGR